MSTQQNVVVIFNDNSKNTANAKYQYNKKDTSIKKYPFYFDTLYHIGISCYNQNKHRHFYFLMNKTKLERITHMKYTCTVISVSDIEASKKFYKDLFGLEIYQDYGRNISFTCGLSLQQDFDWLINLPKEKVLKKANNVEIAFEESNFDEFLIQLKKYPNIEYLGEVMEHTWG